MRRGGSPKEQTSVLRFGRFRRRLLLLPFEAGVPSCRKLGLEFFDATFRIDKFLFPCIEGMADATDIDLQLFARAACGKFIAATALHLAVVIFGMNVWLHGSVLQTKGILNRGGLASVPPAGRRTLQPLGISRPQSRRISIH